MFYINLCCWNICGQTICLKICGKLSQNSLSSHELKSLALCLLSMLGQQMCQLLRQLGKDLLTEKKAKTGKQWCQNLFYINQRWVMFAKYSVHTLYQALNKPWLYLMNLGGRRSYSLLIEKVISDTWHILPHLVLHKSPEGKWLKPILQRRKERPRKCNVSKVIEIGFVFMFGSSQKLCS